jgi:hypothetical protein
MDHHSAAAGLVGLVLILCAAIVGLALFAFWIWMLIHAISNKGLKDTEKLIWVIVILFLHFLGAMIYFFVGKPKAVGG